MDYAGIEKNINNKILMKEVSDYQENHRKYFKYQSRGSRAEISKITKEEYEHLKNQSNVGNAAPIFKVSCFSAGQ